MSDTLKSFMDHGFLPENDITEQTEPYGNPQDIPRVADEANIISDIAFNKDPIESTMNEVDLQRNLIKDLLSMGLSDIGQSADLTSVYRNLEISGKHLEDSHLLCLKDYPMLFTLDISDNDVTDLVELGSLKYLVTIDASKNKLIDKIEFKGPANLQNLDLSENRIEQIDALQHHRYLQRLYLNNNLISRLDVLPHCKYLKVLSLSSNKITSLEPLRNLPIQQLDISHNLLQSLDAVEDLKGLQELVASNNQITNLKPLEAHPTISYLDLQSNRIIDVENLDILSTIETLRELLLNDNPIVTESNDIWMYKGQFPLHKNATFKPSFRLFTLFKIPRITVLDDISTLVEEKVAAVNTYNPDTKVALSTQHMNMVKLSAKKYATIKAEDLMMTKRLTPVVICGPTGVGKRSLTAKLVEDYPHIYAKCISYTTREPRDGEENGIHYHFVSQEEMNRMNSECKFVELVTILGNQYGTTIEGIDHVTSQGKVCVLDLDYEGIISLKKSRLKPRYILVKPPSLEELKQRLENTQKDTKIVDQWIERAKQGVYSDYEYDLVITNDDFDNAYRNLRDFCVSSYWKDFEDEDG